MLLFCILGIQVEGKDFEDNSAKAIMDKIHGFILDATYKVEQGKAVIYLFCLDDRGNRFCIRDTSLEPYFFVHGGDESIIRDIKTEDGYIVRTEKVTKYLHGKEITLTKVFTNLPKSVPSLSQAIKKLPGVTAIFENDILFARRYLLDKNLIPHTGIIAEGEWVKSEFRVSCLDIIHIQKEEKRMALPRILAFDIETYTPSESIDPEKNPILMIGCIGDNFRRILTWKKFPTGDKEIEFVLDEKAMILRFLELIAEYQPHIICGYNSDNFDWPYTKKRADKLGVSLLLGLDSSPIMLSEDAVRIIGISHIDMYRFIKRILGRSLETDIFTLNAVAEELLHEKKHSVDIYDMTRVWDHEPEKLEPYAQYNAQDALLTYKLCRLLWPNLDEFTTLIGLPAESVSRMSYSQLVEQYILRQAQSHGELAPSKPNENELTQRIKRIKGGYVYEPLPGLYHNIVVLDFRSLYPSIIVSHNISPSSLCCSCCADQEVLEVHDQKYWFCQKKRGFLSVILEQLVQMRGNIKKQVKEATGDAKKLLTARSEALKLLSNSFYGYLGFAAARWYSLACAEATTALGRKYIQAVIQRAQDKGFSVLYADTDSLFLHLGQKTKEDAKDFQQMINASLPGMMELEWENFYPSGIFVAVKGTGGGAKKRYALVDEKGVMKIRGFETVRRNVAPIAKEVQETVLNMLLKEGDAKKAAAYIKQIMKDVSQKKIPKEKMIIFTQLQKEIKHYENISPHVAAAARMNTRGTHVGAGSFIRYFISHGSGKLRDRVRLPEEAVEYDAEYYIHHQILPSIEKIMEVFGYKADDFLSEDKQSALSGFW